MELRLKEARATKDIDLALRQTLGAGKDRPLNDVVLEALREAAAQDLSDFFSFVIGEAMRDLDGAPYGGARFPVEARLDDRTFVRFHIDVGNGDVVMMPLDTTEGRDWLKFAGIPPATFPTISREQHFAEKVHAYTLPRPSANTRVRDLVDMVLLITAKPPMDLPLVKKALEATFKRRGTHPIPKTVPPPSADWKAPYAALARECGISEDLDEAFKLLSEYLG